MDDADALAERLKQELARQGDGQSDLFAETIAEAGLELPARGPGRPRGSPNRRQASLVRLVELEKLRGRSLLHVLAEAARLHEDDEAEDFGKCRAAAKVLGCEAVEVLRIKAGLLKTMAPYMLQQLGSVSSDQMNALISVLLTGRAPEGAEATAMRDVTPRGGVLQNPDFPEGYEADAE